MQTPNRAMGVLPATARAILKERHAATLKCMRRETSRAIPAQGASIIGRVELYGQDAELSLLARLLPRLENRTLMDVGAERGAFALAMRRAGIEALHAFEPHPGNVALLHRYFDDDPAATILECAVSETDGSGALRVASSPTGVPLPFAHTLLEREDTDEVKWRDVLRVPRRSLSSLIDGGEIPSRSGILKVDTEGSDLAVIRGMGPLIADIVMVEHWSELPQGLGRCPWSSEEMIAELRVRGFTHFALIAHRGEFVTLKWDDAEIERGAMGNLVFINELVLERVLGDVLDCAGLLAERAVKLGQRHLCVARERTVVIDELQRAAEERLALIHELEQTANERLDLIAELDARVKAASATSPAS